MDTDRPLSGGRRGSAPAATAAARAAGLVLALTLCGGSGYAGAPPAAAPAPVPPPAGAAAVAPLPRSEPVALEVPAIGLRTDGLVGLGLRPDGEIEVPRDYGRVGWYTHGPAPGQVGAAVLGGHVDSGTAPAVFHRLAGLRPGDTAAVDRADGSTALFTVYAVHRYPKADFPTDLVYGPTGGRAELRLITCGGEFDHAAGSYRDNTVVFARLSAVRPEARHRPS